MRSSSDTGRRLFVRNGLVVGALSTRTFPAPSRPCRRPRRARSGALGDGVRHFDVDLHEVGDRLPRPAAEPELGADAELPAQDALGARDPVTRALHAVGDVHEPDVQLGLVGQAEVALVSRFDGQPRVGVDEQDHRGDRRGDARLEANVLGDHALVLELAEAGVGGSRLILESDAGKRQFVLGARLELGQIPRRLVVVAGRDDLQGGVVLICAGKRPSGPAGATARLAVGKVAQVAPQCRRHGATRRSSVSSNIAQ